MAKDTAAHGFPRGRGAGELFGGKWGNFVGFEVSTAVTMKDVVFWDIKPSLYLTGDTSRLRYRTQPVNAVWGNSRCLL
jgi:hypothetical protein